MCANGQRAEVVSVTPVAADVAVLELVYAWTRQVAFEMSVQRPETKREVPLTIAAVVAKIRHVR